MSFSHTFNRSSHRRLDFTAKYPRFSQRVYVENNAGTVRGWRHPAWERLESDKLVRPYIIICDRQVKPWQVRADILIRRSIPPCVLSITIVTSLATPSDRNHLRDHRSTNPPRSDLDFSSFYCAPVD